MESEPSAAADRLAQRCRSMGWVMLTTDPLGAVLRHYAAEGDALAGALASSPMIAAALLREAALWADAPKPPPSELWRGCWAVPLPIVTRRRRSGYHVVVLLARHHVDREQFSLLCAAAQMDRQSAEARITGLQCADEDEVLRTAAMLQWMAEDLHGLNRHRGDVESLSQQLGETYEELSLLYNLSAHMTVTQDPYTFLYEACQELQQVVGLRWLALHVTDDDPRLNILQQKLVLCGNPGCSAQQLTQISRAVFEQFGKGGPVILDDTRPLAIQGLSRIAQRLLIVPMVSDGRALGVLLAADKLHNEQLSTVDSKLMTSAVQSMGIFLENAMLYEDMQDMFMGTLHSLVSAIDAKDTYTCGHSQRVALLSRQLAVAAGLDPLTVERVYLCGLVHDVGKIGVPEAVLCKAGRLTEQEFDLMRAHPDIGVGILGDIRQMKDLLPGVRHHHERWDGRGYPSRLSGTEIPLFGRLIALADSFDAMSSDRTYRKAMSLESVLAEIRRCSGSQFDSQLADVFVDLDFQPVQQLLGQHQQRHIRSIAGQLTVQPA